jgi:flavin-dependent dehydrogenase
MFDNDIALDNGNLFKSDSNTMDYDVAIVGAGWAGLCLARQLKRENPTLKIIQLDSSTEFKSKVGEATVEITGHYFIKKLGLANYLYRNQLPKNALRFFYDSEVHDIELDKMSEQGTTYIPPHPAFQLERASFERDLVCMNRSSGIDIVMGAKVNGFELDHHSMHRLDFKYQEKQQSLKSKWLIDASGRACVVTRKMEHHFKQNIPEHGSAWGRFSGVKDFDSMGSQEWRNRASSRFLSTNHFTGEGYWIWFIPLQSGLTSIGVVYDKARALQQPRKQVDFLELLNSHKSIASLIENAQIEDFEAWGKLAYRGKGIATTQRWGATGFAAFFLDPLLSPGGDVIALSNDALTQIITTDLAESDPMAAQENLDMTVPKANKVLDTYFQYLYAQLMNLYPILDCAELCAPVMSYTNANYFITSSWDYMAGNFSNYQYFSDTQYLRRGYFVLEKMLQQQILQTVNILKAEKRYFKRNSEGFFETGNDLYKYYIYNMGEKNKDGYRIDIRLKLFVYVFSQVTGVKLALPHFAQRKQVQSALCFSTILGKPKFERTDLPGLMAVISKNMTEELQKKSKHKVIVLVTEDSFYQNSVELILDGSKYEQAELKKIQSMADSMWNQKQEYIEQNTAVPIFLKFARGLPEDVFDSKYPVKQELEKTKIIDLETVSASS